MSAGAGAARGLGLQLPLPRGTDLPVLLPAARRLLEWRAGEIGYGLLGLRLTAGHGALLVLVFLVSTSAVEAAAGRDQPGVVATLLNWTPQLLLGFVFNLLISVLAMAIGTAAGVFLGLAQISLLPPVKKGASFVTHFFRNAPWLVLLFYCMFLLPFQITIFGLTIPLPDWVKATFGLSLPVMANVSEIVRGAIQSIPTGQWESATSLAFSRRQTIWMIILPQCVKRMLPPWMNLYAILAMDTVLASIVGVEEVMTLTREALGSVSRPEMFLLPFYSYVLVWFFIYCYPIARWTVHLERKFAVNI